ncbi:SDR family NAD(P)-dependent oxidoreductase [Paenibacillus sp. EC2-1]|uniref:SDR family NAD(P)-dependent oxidoreductase n=1 Tax=Paenibacillus sp. EC2-1 TaxID=3388665 RepID=UPI003BEED1E3
MSRNHFIITGTSRGIGNQLAKMLLENGNVVHGISRGDSPVLSEHENYTHHPFDLGQISSIQDLLLHIFSLMDLSNSEMICLINNAAMLEPLKTIDKCTPEEINLNLQTSLIAPIVLTSCFMNQTSEMHLRRKIVNISSGSGTYPAPAMSVYCTAKAGINMFTACVGAEQANQLFPVEIVAVDPGMVETELQMIARGKADEQFEMAKYFRQAHDTGQLLSTETLGEHLLRIIEKKIEPGKLVAYSDI